MAGKGTYGAYITQQPTPSGEWAGASQVSSMAAAENQKRAEERAEQRQIRHEARESIRTAIEASEIDLSEIEASVHGGIGMVLDDYAEGLTERMENLQNDYSFAKQMELKKYQTEFQGKINAFTAIGEKMKLVGSKEWDNTMSMAPVSGNADFIAKLPEYMERLDPKTMTVDGKHISKIYDEAVNLSELYDPIDSEGALVEIAKVLKEDAEKNVFYEGDDKIGVNKYTYDEARTRQLFTSQIKGTLEYKKIVRNLLTNYEVARDEALLPYVTVNDDEVEVTEANVYKYFKDMYLPSEVPMSREEMLAEKESLADRRARSKAQDDEDLILDRISKVEDPFVNRKIQVTPGMSIKIGNGTFNVSGGGMGYDVVSGSQVANILYEKADGATGKQTGIRSYQLGLEGMQEFGYHLFGDFDYRRNSADFANTPSYKALNFGERAASVKESSEILSSNILSAYTDEAGQVAPNHANGIERMKYQLKQSGLESGVITKIIGDLSKKKSSLLGQRNFTTVEDQVLRADALTFGALYAKSLERDGLSEDKVYKLTKAKISEFINKGKTGLDNFEFEFDRVARVVKDRAKGNTGKEIEMFRAAQDFMQINGASNNPITDEDIIKHLDSKKWTTPSEIESSLKKHNIEPSIWAAAVEKGLSLGLTREQVLKALIERQNKK